MQKGGGTGGSNCWILHFGFHAVNIFSTRLLLVPLFFFLVLKEMNYASLWERSQHSGPGPDWTVDHDVLSAGLKATVSRRGKDSCMFNVTCAIMTENAVLSRGYPVGTERAARGCGPARDILFSCVSCAEMELWYVHTRHRDECQQARMPASQPPHHPPLPKQLLRWRQRLNFNQTIN